MPGFITELVPRLYCTEDEAGWDWVGGRLILLVLLLGPESELEVVVFRVNKFPVPGPVPGPASPGCSKFLHLKACPETSV